MVGMEDDDSLGGTSDAVSLHGADGDGGGFRSLFAHLDDGFLLYEVEVAGSGGHGGEIGLFASKSRGHTHVGKKVFQVQERLGFKLGKPYMHENFFHRTGKSPPLLFVQIADDIGERFAL